MHSITHKDQVKETKPKKKNDIENEFHKADKQIRRNNTNNFGKTTASLLQCYVRKFKFFERKSERNKPEQMKWQKNNMESKKK